jgi:serine/threonine-protein kinase
VADEIIIDEFTLINHLATGGSTQVWEAIDTTGGKKHYAMKLMLPEAFSQQEQKQVLKHEAKLTERFDHPNLVRFHKLIMNKQRGYFVMEYFRAPNVKSQIQSDLASLQCRVGRLFEQMAQALGYLHEQGWVHRDIKPDNILFNKGSELRLIDFSLSTKIAGAMSKMLGGKEKVIQGTRTYISPETILKAPPSPQADIYSLGITLFEILAGEPPFRGTSPDDLLKKHLTTPAPEPSFFNPNVTSEMDRFVLRMLAKRPKDRQKNTQELLAEFRNIKPFKEDVLEVDRRKKADEKKRGESTLDKSGRLDSRADHVRQQLFKDNPELASPKAPPKPKVAAAVTKPAATKPASPAAAPTVARAPAAVVPSAPPTAPLPAAPQQPMMPPGYPSGPPPYGYPGYGHAPYPGGPYQPPGQMPGYPYPGGYAPQGMPAPPGYAPPGYAPQGMPSYPGQSGPPAMPYGGMPYGSQQPMPSAPTPVPAPVPAQRGPMQTAAPSAPRSAAPVRPTAAALPAITDQQQLLQQMLGQPGAPQPAPPQSKTPPDLPLMDQLPPVK